MRLCRIAVVNASLLFTTLLAQSKPALLFNKTLDPTKTGSTENGSSKAGPSIQGKIVESYGKLPLSFEANQGQTDPQVKFLSRGSGYTLFLTGDEAVFSLHGRKTDGEEALTSPRLKAAVAPKTNSVVRMKLLRANRTANVTGANELPGKSNYFLGHDRRHWYGNVKTYAEVKYTGVYPGIDLIYYGNQRQLEYDFVVAPGADPRRIQLEVRGAKKISRDNNGDLVLRMVGGDVRWQKPVVYQEKDGKRRTVAARYVVEHKNRVGFLLADYDPGRPLFIDPLVYSTYLGGSQQDYSQGIAVDNSGSAYVVGFTSSTDFPTMDPWQPYRGATDAFVTKLNATGSALIYSTYLGGSSNDYGYGIAIDSSGDAYVTGSTTSTDFPITPGAFQTTCGEGCSDAFVTELNPTGTALVYSTYLGGSGQDQGDAIAVDSSGNAYVTGFTTSTNFPRMNPVQPSSGGSLDAFVTEFNATGSALIYSTYLGGSSNDYGYSIAIDSSGDAYVTGSTTSTDFPTVNPLQAYGGNGDAFVSELSPSGSAIVYSTYLGGSGTDWGQGIVVDLSGDAYVIGSSASTDFPTVNPLQAYGGNGDAFVSELSPSGSAIVYSTYLGGSGTDYGYSIAVDSSGDAYVTGFTASTDFSTVTPLQPTYGGGFSDAFLTKLNTTGSALVYSTYLGGSGEDIGYGIAVDNSDNAYVTGLTVSTNFRTVNPLQPTYGGNWDAFISKISTISSAAVNLVPPSLDFSIQTVGLISAPRVSTLTNTGEISLAITSIDVTGLNSSDFAETNTCGTAVSAGGTCTITVVFTPAATGARTASVRIIDNASDSPQSVQLSGIGVEPAVTLFPGSLSFPTQVVFTSSSTQTVTLTNTGAGILEVSRITATGPFLQTNTCGTSLNPGTSCTISVRFKPQKKGQLSGAVSIFDNAPGTPQKAKLTGVGTFIQTNPMSENFGSQPVGTTSVARQVIVTNKGGTTVSISRISITGTNFADFAQTNTCGSSLASGGSCKIVVTFTPSAKGKRSANISITDNGGGSPQKVSLSGMGT